ncbi:SMRP1 protein, partial [Rhinopomastus cyanomelas]|nr:SMRP1 protein [Rhinopomastus cyanomelas]
MFLLSKKYKTPISTYMDSYRLPCSVRNTFKERTPRLPPKENNFVTQGLWVPPARSPASQGQYEQLIKEEMQQYYRNTMDPAAYNPEKYWLPRSEEKYNPVFVNENGYVAWGTSPYNSEAWDKHLPLLPKETRMETLLQSTPMPCLAKPTCLNHCGWLLLLALTLIILLFAVNSLLPLYSVSGRQPLQGPCSCHHYCLCGMDYCADGTSPLRRHLHTPEERTVSYKSHCLALSNNDSQKIFCSSYLLEFHSPMSDNFIFSLRWKTSHFMSIGGAQKSSFIIHQEFDSEALSAP